MGQQVVSVGQYSDGLGMATFGSSSDGGATWQAGVAHGPDRAVVESASAVAVRTNAETSTWLATGSSGRRLASWSSVNGLKWERHLFAADIADPDTDAIYDLTAADSGFIAGGRSIDANDLDHPRVWTSKDGSTWAVHKLPGEGAVTGVAARGDTVVAVGRTTDDWLVWRSTNRGVTWAKITRIPRMADDGAFNRSFDDVAVQGSDFVAIGSFYAKADIYQPTVYRSRDGASWSWDRSSGSLTSGDSFGRQLVSQGDQMMAVVESNRTLRQDRVYHWAGGHWRPTSDPRGAGDQAEWVTHGLTRSATGWLAATSRQLNASVEPHLWMARTPRVFTETGAPQPPRDVPRSDPQKTALWAGTWRVYGQSRDRRVLWSQRSDGIFNAPQPVDVGPQAAVQGLAVDGRAMLAYGLTNGGNANHATTWLSTDGKTFTPSAEDTFEKVNRYSYSSIHDIVRIGRTWFAVGERSINGGLNVSALIYTSTDGKHWQAGKAARTMKKAEGDIWYDVTDLAGDHDRKRTMYDVVRTSRDYLAVGTTEENGPSLATVWHSDRGTVWRSKVIGAQGYHRSGISNAASIGSRTVLYGWAAHRGEIKTTPYVWWSSNGGKSWHGRALGQPGEQGGYLVATQTSFVLTGTPEAEISAPWFHQSTDGEHWRGLAVSGYPTTDPSASTYLSDVKADGRDLVCLVTVENRAGSGSVLVRQPVG